jgi:hypothetical protein
MDQLGCLPALREADRAQVALDEPGEEPCRFSEAARPLPQLGVEQGRVPQGDRPLRARCAVTGDDLDLLTEQRAPQLGRISDRGRGEQELGGGSLAAGEPPEAAQDVGDVGAEDAAVHVGLVDDDVAQVVEDVLPTAVTVVGEDPDGEHVRVREDDVRLGTNVAAQVVRRVPVVDPHPHAT